MVVPAHDCPQNWATSLKPHVYTLPPGAVCYKCWYKHYDQEHSLENVIRDTMFVLFDCSVSRCVKEWRLGRFGMKTLVDLVSDKSFLVQLETVLVELVKCVLK